MLENKYVDTLSVKQTKSQDVGFLGVLHATVMKDLLITTRYKANLIGGVIEVTILVLSFFAMSLAVDFRGSTLFVTKPEGNVTFIFLLAGVMLIIFQNSAFFVPLNSVSRDLYNGTLEYLYSSSSSRYAYYLGTIVADIIVRQIFFFPMFLLLFLSGSSGAVLPMLVVMVIFFVMVTGIGILISLLGLLYKQVGNIVGVISLLMQFLGGTFIPVQSMPSYISWAAYILPITYALDLIRYYAYQGNWIPVLPVEMEWFLLILASLLFLIASIVLLRVSEKRVKRSGLHLL